MKNSKDFIMILLLVTVLCLGSYVAYQHFYLNNKKVCEKCETCEECEVCEEQNNYHSWCKDEDNCYEEIVDKKFYQVLDEKASSNNVPGVIELKKDNTFVMVVNQCEYLAKAYGTYEVNEDELTLHYKSSDYDVTIPEEMIFNITSGDQLVYKGDDPIACAYSNLYITSDLMSSLTKKYSN